MQMKREGREAEGSLNLSKGVLIRLSTPANHITSSATCSPLGTAGSAEDKMVKKKANGSEKQKPWGVPSHLFCRLLKAEARPFFCAKPPLASLDIVMCINKFISESKKTKTKPALSGLLSHPSPKVQSESSCILWQSKPHGTPWNSGLQGQRGWGVGACLRTGRA